MRSLTAETFLNLKIISANRVNFFGYLILCAISAEICSAEREVILSEETFLHPKIVSAIEVPLFVTCFCVFFIENFVSLEKVKLSLRYTEIDFCKNISSSQNYFLSPHGKGIMCILTR